MRGKVVKLNVISNLLLQVVVIFYGFIVPKIIIKNFGSNVNGLVSSITNFLAYIALLESGFGPVVKATLYKPIAEKNKSKIASILRTTEKFFRKIAIIFVLYIIILCIVYPIFVNSDFDKLFTISLILIISASTFAEYFFGMTYQLYLQSCQKNYVVSFIQIFVYILTVIIIVILSVLDFSIILIKAITGIIFILRPIIQNIYVRKKLNVDLKKCNQDFRLKNKWDGLAQHFASVIHGNTDITLLTIFCSLSEVSVYSVYYLVVKGIKSIIQAFTSGIDSVFGDMIAKQENESLNRKFSLFEVGYFTICTILFSSTILLIVPFINIYTLGITDTNYVRYIFGYLIVISEYVWAIRSPYISITYAAGHFKETRMGAWIECLSNIIISIILINRFGIVGATIGTLVSMLIRTIEFIYHANKYILNRNILISIKKIALVSFETICIFALCQLLPYLDNINYFNWIINSIMVVVVSSFVTVILNLIFYNKEICQLFKIVLGRVKK